jgi:hypothetical protein
MKRKYCEVKTVYGKQALTGFECIIGYDVVNEKGEVVAGDRNYDQADYYATNYERQRELEAGEREVVEGYNGRVTREVN